MTTSQLHTVKPLDVDIPRGRLVAVTGVSGSGKTTMVLESLIPALKAQAAGELLPEHVRELETEGIRRANLIDATPIGANVRSTVATYADIHDELRRAFARCEAAKTGGWKAWRFLIQYRPTALPYVRRHRFDLARRAVPAGCDHRMPGLLRLPVRARS